MIIDRKAGYTNAMMIENLERLERVMSQTKTIKRGRGRNTKNIEIPKYPDSKKILRNIRESINHYKKLQENEI